MTFIALDSRSDLPRVTYPTALDIYIVLCYLFLFCCICEFAVVHTYTKYSTADPEMKKYERQRVKSSLSRELLYDHYCRRNARDFPQNTGKAILGNGVDYGMNRFCSSKRNLQGVRFELPADPRFMTTAGYIQRWPIDGVCQQVKSNSKGTE